MFVSESSGFVLVFGLDFGLVRWPIIIVVRARPLVSEMASHRSWVAMATVYIG